MLLSGLFKYYTTKIIYAAADRRIAMVRARDDPPGVLLVVAGKDVMVAHRELSYNTVLVTGAELLSKAKIQGLKVYFNADDPFCFDHYLKGWDPEQGTNTYIARTFTFGVDLKFDWGLNRTKKYYIDVDDKGRNLSLQVGVCYKFEL